VNEAPYFPEGLAIPVPEIDGLSAPFWNGLIREKLLLQRCKSCSEWQWGPEWICHHCHSFDIGWEECEPRGDIYTAARVWHPVNAILSKATPYWLVVVSLPSAGNVRLAGNLLGDPMQDAPIGAPVTGQFEHHPGSDPPFSLLQWRLAGGGTGRSS
jgi:uncharacterized OB-fold protein